MCPPVAGTFDRYFLSGSCGNRFRFPRSTYLFFLAFFLAFFFVAFFLEAAFFLAIMVLHLSGFTAVEYIHPFLKFQSLQ